MYKFPETERKLKARISSYKSKLSKEKKELGYINDGTGKRYLLFPLYLVLGDLNKFEEYITWFDKEFPDDTGEPIQRLCCALGLKRLNKVSEATLVIAKLILDNLYIIPFVCGRNTQKIDMWHNSNYSDIDYLNYIDDPVLESITEDEKGWLASFIDTLLVRRVVKAHADAFNKLQNLGNIEQREVVLNQYYKVRSKFFESVAKGEY